MRIARWICVVLVLIVSIALVPAQGHTKTTHHKTSHKVAMKGNVYACPKCEVASKTGGKCPMCGEKMEKVSAKMVYACSTCHTTSSHAGKCPKCGEKMQKMAMTYACEDCHESSTKAGKCPKCGADMKQYFMKMTPKKGK